MPLLLLPLLVLVLLALWLVLWPVALWMRYRSGHARRRALAWVVAINAWSLLFSAGLFLGSAGLLTHWVDAALAYATAGLVAGLVVGCLGLALTRFEVTPAGLYYTPNRWLVLALTLIVAARIVVSMIRMWQAWGAEHSAWLPQQGGLLAVGGLLLGHYLAYVWGLRRRLRRLQA
jgi:hypothetical protein